MYLTLHPSRFLHVYSFFGKGNFFFILGSLDYLYIELKVHTYNHFYWVSCTNSSKVVTYNSNYYYV